ncbi:MAG: class I SAM-dependent methyltransferase [Betaproteobacteria bacterium]|nr:class I SAM-dependent methyltransferase [Betaproteobacteria bacterium]
MKDGFEKRLCCSVCGGPVELQMETAVREGDRVKEGSIACRDHGEVFQIVETVVVERFGLNQAKQDVQDFWSHHPCMGEWDDERKQMEEVREYRYRTHPWLPREVSEFERHGNDVVLEIGCSQGIDMTEFVRSGVKEYIGLDLTLKGLLLAKRRLEYYGLYDRNVNLLCADAEGMPLAGEQIDYVYSYGVIHHSENTQRIIDQIHRVLGRGGTFMVMYYYKYSLTTFVEGTAKFINKTLIFLARDKDVFWKICKWLPYRPEIGHYRKFLDTGYSAILHAPFAHMYGKRESRKMFSRFSIRQMRVYQLSPVVRPLIRKLFGERAVEALARWIGWDLVIKGNKV